MAKNNLQQHNNRLKRYSHNISAGYSNSLVTGPIVPQYYHVLSSGDSIYFDFKSFARLRDVVTAFFGEIEIEADAFFVPMQMLYTPFGQLFALTQDFVSSSAMPSNTSGKYPIFNIDKSCESIDPTQRDFFYSECNGKSAMRLFDSLGLNPLTAIRQAIDTSPMESDNSFVMGTYSHSPNISPWLICAYHAIYQRYFRNDAIESIDVTQYNVDRFSQIQVNEFSEDMLLCHHCQRLSDYFTDAKVSPIGSIVGTLDSSFDVPLGYGDSEGSSDSDYLAKFSSFLTGSLNASSTSFRLNSYSQLSGDVGGELASEFSSAGSDIEFLPTAQGIRTLFAVDKFLRVYARAGKTYDDQILAHFGVKIPHDVKHDITHIAHGKGSITTEPIYSTSQTESANIGQVGGQGTGMLSMGKHKFKAPVHGVFMIVAYARVKPRYYGTFDKLNLLTERLSFPIPEFADLGLQPMYGFEGSSIFFSHEGTSVETNNQSLRQYRLDKRVGWQERYQQFKRKYNRVSIAFMDAEYFFTSDSFVSRSVNAYAPWFISRAAWPNIGFRATLDDTGDDRNFNINDAVATSMQSLFEPVTSLDVVMSLPFAGNWHDDWSVNPWLTFQTDPIILESYCDAKLVSWLHKTGDASL